jgi:hydrogenase maturation protein HypF
LGAELKNTIAVAKDCMVVASHHIGDLEHLPTYRSFLQALDHLRHLYGVTPDVVAHDLHPEYLSTKLAMELDLPTCAVQHHHAHVASCMVDHGRTDRVLGIAFDGMGYGIDGTMWGGEFLLADLDAFVRVGHLCPVTMPGGVAAIREPWRMGVAWATHAGAGERALSSFSDVDATGRDAVRDLVERAAGPVTTSVGRLFDAVAALLDGRRRVSYEGQAAMELEGLARTVARPDAPSFDGLFDRGEVGGLAVLDPAPLLRTIVEDRDRYIPVPVLAAGFHEALGRATASLAADLARTHGLDTVALTGGVFQNARFTEVVEAALHEEGLHVLVHQQVPPNDGGISIGQAAIAARGGAGAASGGAELSD